MPYVERGVQASLVYVYYFCLRKSGREGGLQFVPPGFNAPVFMLSNYFWEKWRQGAQRPTFLWAHTNNIYDVEVFDDRHQGFF